MKTNSQVFIVASSMLTSLGLGVDANFRQLKERKSGIQMVDDDRFFSSKLPLSKIADDIIEQQKDRLNTQTRFDTVLLACADDLLQVTPIDLSSPDVLVILSTTKGNIELLSQNEHDPSLRLSYSANLIKEKFKQPNDVLVISNACISGLSAIIVAKRFLQSGRFKHAVVIGCDVLSRFVLSGFHSFHAISMEACKPFDKNRNGITLGEAAAAMILSTEIKSDIDVLSGFISNDSNHISGPSKTGEELSYCINASLIDAGLNHDQIDFISAHGTATEYNDEMESKAFELSQLTNSPVFSLKGAYGHTLGASGVLETIIATECLKRDLILSSQGFTETGVSGNILMSQEVKKTPLKYALKTASGFGGCNAAILLRNC